MAAHGPGFRTGWHRRSPYLLDELAVPIPRHWRMPTIASTIRTEAGRNCYLFCSAMKWAGSPSNLAFEVLPAALAANVEHFSSHRLGPLLYGDVQALAKSVERYRRRWISQGRFWGKRKDGEMGQGRFTWDSEAQTRRGKLRDTQHGVGCYGKDCGIA